MKKYKLIGILFFLVTSVTYSQTTFEFRGIIKDSETNETIPFVNITFDNDEASIGAISNENGEFIIPQTVEKINFKHLGYETVSFLVKELKDEIKLKPKSFILDEVLVSNISAKDYLKSIIKSAEIKTNKNTKFESYCREIVKVNNKFTKYSDALIDYYITKDNGKSGLVLTQHRAFKQITEEEEQENPLEGMDSGYDVRDFVKNAYKFDRIKRILKSDNYEFERRIKRDESGFEFEIINVKPKPEIEEMLLEGYVIIDSKTKDVLEYKFYVADSHKKYSKFKNLLILKARLNDQMVWSKFKIVNGEYILIYNKNNADITLKMGKKIDEDFEFTTDIFVYNYKKNVSIPKELYKEKNIFKAGTKYTEQFWKKYNTTPLKEDEQNFVDKFNN